jgi:hypothetical protein
VEPQRAQRVTENVFSELETFDTVDQLCDIEVEEQSSAHFLQFHIGQDLGLIDGQNLVYRFELHNDLILDQKIQPVTAIKQYILVPHRQRVSHLEAEIRERHLVRQTLLICGFLKTGIQLAVHLHGTAYD